MPSQLRRAAVVYHPLKTDINALASVVSEHEVRAGFGSTLWYETGEADAGAAAAERAIENGAEVVLAAGGDGTVRAVAEVLRGTGVALAIVPEGTGNLLARNLGAPLNDLDALVAAAFTGTERAIDLGVAELTRADGTVDDAVFLVLAGTGLDASIISATNPKLKQSVGWLAYVDAMVRTMSSKPPLGVTFRVDGGQKQRLDVFTVMLGNCGILPGGLLLIPDAQMDDGELDVVALRPVKRLGPFSWLRIAGTLLWENGVLRRSKTGTKLVERMGDVESVTYRKVRRVEMWVDQAEAIQLDGDDFGEVVSVASRVDPGSLVVRVLPDWAPRFASASAIARRNEELEAEREAAATRDAGDAANAEAGADSDPAES